MGTIDLGVDGRADVKFRLHPTEDKVAAICTTCGGGRIMPLDDDPTLDELVALWDADKGVCSCD